MIFLPRCRIKSSFFFVVAAVTCFSLPAAVAQEGTEQQAVPSGEIENFQEAQREAREERIEKAVESNNTGTDPRDFSLKWMPYYRYTTLENGLEQQDLTAFGTVPFSPSLGMFYEVPVAQYRDFSDVPGTPRGH